jgi:hypothetical protein
MKFYESCYLTDSNRSDISQRLEQGSMPCCLYTDKSTGLVSFISDGLGEEFTANSIEVEGDFTTVYKDNIYYTFSQTDTENLRGQVTENE